MAAASENTETVNVTEIYNLLESFIEDLLRMSNEDSIIDLDAYEDVIDLTTPQKNSHSKRKINTIAEIIEIKDSDPNAPKRYKHVATIECPICLEPLQDKNVMSTLCGHIFCTPCIKTSFNIRKTCPKCRRKLTTKSIHPIYFN